MPRRTRAEPKTLPLAVSGSDRSWVGARGTMRMSRPPILYDGDTAAVHPEPRSPTAAVEQFGALTF